jgi:hypothetical protein
MSRTIPLLVLIYVAVTGHAAGDGALDRATLRGIPSVNVVIDHIDPLLPKEGVTAAALQERLEEKLKDAGIVVNTAATEFVGIQITAVRAGRGPYAVSYTIAVYQAVALRRDATVRTVTKTWEVETILMSDAKSLMHASIESVDDLASRFITAYRSVNPK